MHILSLLIALLSVSGAIVASEPNSTAIPPPAADSLAKARYIIQIEKLETTKRSLYDTLDVTLESFGNSIAAFGLKIGSTHPAVDIINILPGALIDTCDWDFFKADRVDTKERANYPRTLWKAVALSKTSADTSRPACVDFKSKITIARLVVATPPSARITDTLAPLFFFWEDCRDNAVSDASGQSLIFSSKIFDYLSVPLNDETDIFPSRFGTPNQCIKPDAINKPERSIEFHNGGVLFRSPGAEGKLQDKPADPSDKTHR